MHGSDTRLGIEECPLNKSNTTQQCKKPPRTLKGPLRVLRLCILGILLPALLVGIPLYMRYHVYGHQLYPLAMSDMRLIDNKVSTTWCQRQLVKVNTTFNAFLLPKAPQLSEERKPLTMVRQLELEDDTREYWGFYLLKGSSVTVSTCVRWPGASLIVIRGHKHLHECAYIGDNSSEELDELMESIKEQAIKDQPANQPDLMKRHREDVEFHDPSHNLKNYTKIKAKDHSESSDITDTKTMQMLLEALKARKQSGNKKVEVLDHPHFKRNSTIAKDENKNVQIQNAHPETYSITNDGKNTTKSEEIFDDIMNKLQNVDKTKGINILEKLNHMYQNKSKSLRNKNEAIDNKKVIDMKGRHYSKPPVEYNDNIDNMKRRRRREVVISSPLLKNLNEDDEKNDRAIEEGLQPDGIADHRGTFNETDLNDMSNSEFWSSFSSSEEALLNCAGLILNLPLTPHHKCTKDLPESEAEETYLANTVTYRVPTNGYYFFVFSSENEVQTNYMRVHFHLQKTFYNTSDSVAQCMNSSSTCALDLKFFSNEKLVMELPVKENESLWNEEFIVVSECEPRTAIYAACVITVPVLVILFAFS